MSCGSLFQRILVNEKEERNGNIKKLVLSLIYSTAFAIFLSSLLIRYQMQIILSIFHGKRKNKSTSVEDTSCATVLRQKAPSDRFSFPSVCPSSRGFGISARHFRPAFGRSGPRNPNPLLRGGGVRKQRNGQSPEGFPSKALGRNTCDGTFPFPPPPLSPPSPLSPPMAIAAETADRVGGGTAAGRMRDGV